MRNDAKGGEPGNDLHIAKELLRSTDNVINTIYGLTVVYAIAATIWDEIPFKSSTESEANAMKALSLTLTGMWVLFVFSSAKVMRDMRWNALVDDDHRRVARSAWDSMPLFSIGLIIAAMWYVHAAILWMVVLRRCIPIVTLAMLASVLTRNREDAAKLK